MKYRIEKHFKEIKKILNNSEKIIQQTSIISNLLKKKVKSKNKIYVAGNGGSFADAAHFVGELTATYTSKKRKALPFILLGSNNASVTGWSNDYKFSDYLSREFSALSSKGDVLFLFSTSGGNYKKKQSLNLIKLAKQAKKKKNLIISLLGKGGGVIKNLSNQFILVDSYKTGSIQETHKIIFHSICETFENFK